MDREVKKIGDTVGVRHELGQETPESVWERIRQEFNRGLVECLDEDEITRERGVLWRGHDPDEVLRLLKGEIPGIHLESHRPNATVAWRSAITHTSDESPYPFNLAIGFKQDRSSALTVVSRHGVRAGDLPAAALQLQEGNVIVVGDVTLDDIVFLAVRPHGTEPGKPGRMVMYKIGTDVLMYHIKKEHMGAQYSAVVLKQAA